MVGRAAGGVGVLATALTSFGLFSVPSTEEFRVEYVNEHDELLSDWPDERPDCRFFNNSVVFKSELCSHFVLSRPSSSPARAFDRALTCAASFREQCILSPEIGLAIPAAFLVGHDAVNMVIAPRLVSSENETLVRIREPNNVLSSKTRRLNATVLVEFLDGKSRRVSQKTFYNDDAFCIQLLRSSFHEDCWRALD